MSEPVKKAKKPISKSEAIRQLWELGNLKYKLEGIQLEMYDTVYNSKGKKTIYLVSRRSGKCLLEGTEVITTEGMKKIEDIKYGDYVYGFNKDGSVTPTKVLGRVDQGTKTVTEMMHGARVLEVSTKEHPWWVHNTRTGNGEQRTTEEILRSPHLKIKREFVQSPCGQVDDPHTYALGALLGDGCCCEKSGNSLVISAENGIIPEAIAQDLGCVAYKQNDNNYSWKLSLNSKLEYRGQSTKNSIKAVPYCRNYFQSCYNRKAHEKLIDINIVKTWNRKSCLRFLAGLIDTDGSVQFKNNRLSISIGMQARSVIEAVRFLVKQLFQYDLTIYEDSRDRYKNGSVYTASINNNLFSKIALKELDQYIKLPRKKWKAEYEYALENNSNVEYVGVKEGRTYQAQCWDLMVDNETSLYLTANGLVTHNTFVMMLIATEYCLRNPNSVVKILFPKKKDARSVSRDQMKTILEDCPPHLMPEWKEAQNVYVFNNGSEIQMAGTDGGSAESIRGSKCHLAILDECGFHDFNDFQYIVQSIVMPTLLTTKGKMIMASTPSREPDHPFMSNYIAPARADKTLIEYDIYSNPLISEQDIEDIANEYPLGFDDPDFQREFLLVSNIASDLMVVPEFSKLEDEIVRDSEIPAYYDYYVACDPAVSDTTGMLYAYYDYVRKKLVFRAEDVLGGAGEETLTTDEIADSIIRKEKDLFSNKYTGEVYKPFLRVMDTNAPLLLNDLNIKHGIMFAPTDKTQKEEKINMFRLMLRRGEIEIHPSCKNLLYQIRNAKWKTTRNGQTKTFAHLKGIPHEGLKANHCDLVDCAIYIVRNYVPDKNPYPTNYFDLAGDNIFRGHKSSKVEEATKEFLNSILNINRKD